MIQGDRIAPACHCEAAERSEANVAIRSLSHGDRYFDASGAPLRATRESLGDRFLLTHSGGRNRMPGERIATSSTLRGDSSQ